MKGTGVCLWAEGLLCKAADALLGQVANLYLCVQVNVRVEFQQVFCAKYPDTREGHWSGQLPLSCSQIHQGATFRQHSARLVGEGHLA